MYQNEDACLYMEKCSNESSIILILYVDGMLIVGENKDEVPVECSLMDAFTPIRPVGLYL